MSAGTSHRRRKTAFRREGEAERDRLAFLLLVRAFPRPRVRVVRPTFAPTHTRAAQSFLVLPHQSRPRDKQLDGRRWPRKDERTKAGAGCEGAQDERLPD